MILSQGWVGEAESALDLSHSHLPLLQGVDVDPESVALQLRIYIDVAHTQQQTGSERIQKCRRTCSTSPKTVVSYCERWPHLWASRLLPPERPLPKQGKSTPRS